MNKYYGIVEGFFSFPLSIWTAEERLTTFKFLIENTRKVNTYLYCPKNDLYLVKKWDKLYPKDKLTELKKIITLAKKNKIKFVYGLNPPLIIFKSLNSQKVWIQKLLKKIEQLKKVGCKDFCLLFDDIPFAYQVLEDPTDLAGNLIGESLRNIVEKIYKQLNGTIDQLWLCPPDYCFKKETPFTKQLRLLNKDIVILWSGNDLFVDTIRLSDIKRVKKILGPTTKLIWWDNYPVNDCEQNIGAFNLGAFNSPKMEVEQNLQGILINPMRECFVNLPVYLTFEDYLNSPSRFNREKSWQKALKKIIGKDYKLYLELIYQFSSCNLVDSDKKSFFNLTSQKNTEQIKKLCEELKIKLEKVSQKNWQSQQAKLFITTIKKIFENFQTYCSILDKIWLKRKISLNWYRKYDFFPTNPKITRYFPEILRIVMARIQINNGSLSKDDLKIISRLKVNDSKFQKKYKGKDKLNILKKDEFIIKKLISQAIALEQKTFINFLNNSNKDILLKLYVLAERYSINRFTVLSKVVKMGGN